MNTTQMKLDAISREPEFTSYRSLDNLRPFRGDFEFRNGNSALSWKTMAFLVVFAGVAAIAILEFVKVAERGASLTPPHTKIAQAPTDSPPGQPAGSGTSAEPRQGTELNQATVRMLDKQGEAQEGRSAPAALPKAPIDKRANDRARPLPPSSKSPEPIEFQPPVPAPAPVNTLPPVPEETNNPPAEP